MSQKSSLNGHQSGGVASTEVVPAALTAKAQRRRFSASYKLRILEEAAAAPRGEVGALLRREGLYSSLLDKWRKQRDRGTLTGSTERPRGSRADEQTSEIERLRRENERLRVRLERAEAVIDVQKKLSHLFGLSPETNPNDERI